jgi:signal transduction histidine kinase
VTASIDFSYFLNLFRSLEVGRTGIIAFYRSDTFSQVLRLPPNDDNINTPLPQDSPTRAALAGDKKYATIKATSVTDGSVRIYSYSVLERFPIFVSVGISHEDATAQWRSQSLIVGLSTLFLLALLFVLTIRVYRAEEEMRRLNADLERRVHERTAKLEIANKELEAFAYSIAHDLRTPLRGVASITRIIEEDYARHFDDAGRNLLQRVQNAANRMGELIEALLRLSRLLHTEFKIEAVDLSALAHSVAATLKVDDSQRQVSFDITPRLVVRGDKAQLANLLENLLGNAWKFTSKHADAHIELGITERDGKPVYFVRDNGAGFDMAHAANLFRPFHRLHNDSEYQGHGVGLATVQRIVQRHGGHVRAEGEIEKGATFYFTLAPAPATAPAARAYGATHAAA